jgi:zinc protease
VIRRHRCLAALGFVLAVVVGSGCGSAPPPQAAPPAAAAQPAAVAAAPVDEVLPIDARVTVGRLPNGLTYYVLPHGRPAKRAQLWLAVNAGSVLEDDDQRGLAHFVEHMAFNGTERFAKQALIDTLETMGMAFGPDVNAYTSFDETVYMLQVPTDDRAQVDTGLDILREWATALRLEPAEIEKERGVVLEEWRLGRGAEMRVLDKQYPIIFQGSRYGERLPIGVPDILRSAPPAALARFYRDWYRPDLMAVIAVGDFDAASIEAGIKARFADLAAPTTPRPRVLPPVPRDHAPLVTVVTDPELTRTEVAIYDKLERRPERTVGDYRRLVVEALYHDMLGERLGQLGDDPAAPYVWAYSTTQELARSSDVFQRGAVAKDGKVAEALTVLLAEVRRIERHGFTASELARAKKRTLRHYRQAVKERDKRDGADLTAEVLRNFLEGEQMPGIEAEEQLVQRFLPGITLAELDGLARSWGGSAGRVITVSAPAGGALPSEAEIAALVKRVDRQEVTPWTDEADDRPLLATPPTAGTITGEKTIPEVGVTEWTLSNGARVVWKATTFQNDQIELAAFSPGGASRIADADFGSGRFADTIVADSGAGGFDAVALRKRLAGTVVEVTPFIDELEEGVTGHTAPDDLETFFQLLHLRLTAPRRDPRAFAAWQARWGEMLKNRLLSPETAFFDDMTAFLGRNHPRARPPTAADVAAVDLDKALAVYRDRFADFSDTTFVLVGNLDGKALRPLVETYLASLPATRRSETWKDLGIRKPAGKKTRTVRAGSEPKSYVYLTVHGPERWTRAGERDLVIVSRVLDLRLREVLREELGGVYNAWVDAGIQRRPFEERELQIFFGCDPANADRLRKAALAEVEALKARPIAESYLVKVREQLRRSHEVDLERNEFWAEELQDAYRWKQDPREIVDLAPLLARANAAGVQAAARRYLGTGQYVLGVLEPATGARPAPKTK